MKRYSRHGMVGWRIPVFSVHTVGVLRQEDCEFKASSTYKTEPYLEKQTKASGTVWPNMCVRMSKRAKAHIGMYLYSGIKEKRGRSIIVVREPFPQSQNPVWGPSGQAHKSENR